jgi:transposase
MPFYVGLDVSQNETEICVVDGEGHRVWRGKCASRPESLAETLRQRAPDMARVGMETGPLSVWLWHGLTAAGIPIDCIHARHVVASRSMLELAARSHRRGEVIGSGGEVNRLVGWALGEACPAIDFAHRDLAGCQQRPE